MNNIKEHEKIIPYILKDKELAYKVNPDFIKNEKVSNLISEIRKLGTIDLVILSSNTDYSLEELKEFNNIEVDSSRFEDILNEIYLDFFKSKILTDLLEAKNINSSIKNIESTISLFLKENKLNVANLDSFDSLFEKYTKRMSNFKKYKLGLPKLDKLLTSPLEPEEITILVGQKGIGKSSIIKNIELNLIKEKIPVISFNLEMSLRSNLTRILSIYTGIEFLKILYSYENEKEKEILEEAKKELSTLPYLYNDTEALTLFQIFSLVEEGKKYFLNKGFISSMEDNVIVFIDSLDMVEGFNSPSFVKEQMEILHSLTRKHKVHVVGTVQANENRLRGTSFKSPTDFDSLSFTKYDIYGSSYYAARARLVLFINRPLVFKKEFFMSNPLFDLDSEEDLLLINIIKQNDGELGSATFKFNSKNFRIEEYNEEIADKEKLVLETLGSLLEEGQHEENL